MKSVTWVDHWRYLRFQLISVIAAVGFVIFMTIEHGHQNNDEFIGFAVVLVVLSLVPTLVLHINYFLVNGKDKIDILEDRMRVIHREIGVEVKFDQIDQITCYMTHPYATHQWTALPWDDYHFFVVTVASKNFVVTSLLFPDLHQRIAIDETKVKIVKDWLPLTFLFD